MGDPGIASLRGYRFVAPIHWATLRQTLIPGFSSNYMIALTAVFGTTISPYLFFWQASAEVQEQKDAAGGKPLKLAPEQEAAQLAPMRTDTYIGMAFSNLIAFFIILDAGAVLYVHGGRDIRSATQAVEALRPLASEMAFLLFSIGMHWDHQDRFTCGAGSGEFGCICARRNAEMAHRAR